MADTLDARKNDIVPTIHPVCPSPWYCRPCPLLPPPPSVLKQTSTAWSMTPLAQAVPWASTYELICDAVRAYPERPALTFLHTGQPGGPVTRWTYRDSA